MTAPVAVDVVRVRPGGDPLPLPRYMTPDAAGMDLRADLEAEIVLAPGSRLRSRPASRGRSGRGAASRCATASRC